MKRKGLLWLMLIALVLCSCGKQSDDNESYPEGSKVIYYISQDGYSLKEKHELIDAEKIKDKIEYILEALKKAPEGCSAVIMDKNTPIGFSEEDGIISLVFTPDYTSMSPNSEALTRAAIVKSLCEIDGIEGVKFYIGEQALADRGGEEMGIMSEDSFELTINQKLASITIPLYFTDESGTVLIPEYRTIQYPIEGIPVAYVVNALIDGPENESLSPVLPSNIDINDVSVTDGVCYLYFSSKFLANSLPVANTIPIFALVNTLTELSDISRVQFIVDGRNDVTFRNEISLSKPFATDRGMIKAE